MCQRGLPALTCPSLPSPPSASISVSRLSGAVSSKACVVLLACDSFCSTLCLSLSPSPLSTFLSPSLSLPRPRLCQSLPICLSAPHSVSFHFSSSSCSQPPLMIFLIFLLHPDGFLFISSWLFASLSLWSLPLPVSLSLPPSCCVSMSSLSLALPGSPHLQASSPRGASGLTCFWKGICSDLCGPHTTLWRRIHLFSHAPVQHRGKRGEGGRGKRYFTVTLFFWLYLQAPRQVPLNMPAVLSALPRRNHFSLASHSAELIFPF